MTLMLFPFTGENVFYLFWNPNLLNRIYLGLLNIVSSTKKRNAKLFVGSLKVINVFTRQRCPGPGLGLLFMIQTVLSVWPWVWYFPFYISWKCYKLFKLILQIGGSLLFKKLRVEQINYYNDYEWLLRVLDNKMDLIFELGIKLYNMWS